MDHHALDEQIDQLQQDADDARSGTVLWKEVWGSIRDIGQTFKIVRYPTREEKDAAWKRFQEIVAEVKEGQEQYRQACAREAEELREKIERFAAEVEDAIDRDDEAAIATAGAAMGEIGKAFKQTRFPSRDERDAAWNDYQESANELRKAQKAKAKALDESISQLDSDFYAAERGELEWPEFWQDVREIRGRFKYVRYPSREDRDSAWDEFNRIVGKAEQQRQWADDERRRKEKVSEDVKEEVLSVTVASWRYGLFEVLTGPILHTTVRDTLVERSERLKEAWHTFNENKHDMLGSYKHEVWTALKEAQEELDEAWAEYKDEQAKRQEEWEEKQRRWRERVEANIEKNEERLSKLHEIKARKEEHLTELRAKRDSAWSDNFREKVEGWIEEEEEALGDIDEQISRVEEWLADDRGKLEE